MCPNTTLGLRLSALEAAPIIDPLGCIAASLFTILPRGSIACLHGMCDRATLQPTALLACSLNMVAAQKATSGTDGTR
jgi:hypothetical protein